MNKFEAIQKKLAEAFSNFEAVSQIELNPSPEICITDYKGQSYIIVNIQLTESQCSILDRKTEKTIDFDKAKIFKIINAQKLGFIPIDGKTGLLTGLLTGIQVWKCPVALSQTCYGSKSLKVILMDSNFGGHPVLNPLVTL